jgi:hypothetical protein
MFDFSFFTFEFFSYALFAASFPVLFADIEDWLSDSDSWLGKQFKNFSDSLKDFFTWLGESLKEFASNIVEQIVNFANGVWQLVTTFWAYLRSAFQIVFNFFSDIWLWLKNTVAQIYEFFVWLVTSIWESVTSTIEQIWDLLQDFISYLGHLLWETFLSCGDFLVGFGLDMLMWFFDTLLPDINMPSGFDQGVTYFIQFGMLLNEILPIREALAFFALFITIYIIVGVYRMVRKAPTMFLWGS